MRDEVMEALEFIGTYVAHQDMNKFINVEDTKQFKIIQNAIAKMHRYKSIADESTVKLENICDILNEFMEGNINYRLTILNIRKLFIPKER